ncbi:hypothetical protein Nocox_03465 [Nonomuraea coxensis DSM 45129]|uniref:Uncharacterized protein n=1 Tax=Nonomuraea coxensis DSM 45129 TaxID=1122611 RepID=A0ABX8TU90_9ACTN|nr:hypothetical protein [Nonomuraea coxensis]QYC38322.1 hypothetical protein Nocox_03465 [Nonomuraea coxensis DSM 45129]
MLRNQPRQNQLRRGDLRWLKRQARTDRRITLALLAGVAAAWVRQVPWEVPGGAELLLGLSAGLLLVSGFAWLNAAYLVTRTLRARGEPVEQLRWVSRIRRGKEWAFWAAGAYGAWHLLQFVTALLLRR